MSGILDAVSDFMDELGNFIDKGTKAFVALLIMFCVTMPVSAALSTAMFDTVGKTYEDNPGAQAVIGGAEVAYDFGGFIEDVYEVARILLPVIAAFGGVGAAAIVLYNKLSDYFG